jgi:hypothetical protein
MVHYLINSSNGDVNPSQKRIGRMAFWLALSSISSLLSGFCLSFIIIATLKGMIYTPLDIFGLIFTFTICRIGMSYSQVSASAFLNMNLRISLPSLFFSSSLLSPNHHKITTTTTPHHSDSCNNSGLRPQTKTDERKPNGSTFFKSHSIPFYVFSIFAQQQSSYFITDIVGRRESRNLSDYRGKFNLWRELIVPFSKERNDRRSGGSEFRSPAWIMPWSLKQLLFKAQCKGPSRRTYSWVANDPVGRRRLIYAKTDCKPPCPPLSTPFSRILLPSCFWMYRGRWYIRSGSRAPRQILACWADNFQPSGCQQINWGEL